MRWSLLKALRKLWWHNRPFLVTRGHLKKVVDDAQEEVLQRFSNNDRLEDFSLVGDEALFNYHKNIQLRKRVGLENRAKHLLSPETVALAASNDWLRSDTLHWRHQDIAGLRDFQDVVYTRIWSDPYAHSVVMQFVYYVLGTGYTYDVPNEKITKFLAKFDAKFSYTQFRGIAGEKIFSLMSMGEYYSKVWISPEGDPYIDRVFPYEVTDIIRHPARRNKILAYKVQHGGGESSWIKDIHFDEYTNDADWKFVGTQYADEIAVLAKAKSDEFIHYTKFNLGEEVLGRVPFEPALRDFKYRQDFELSRIVLNRERARVIWKKVMKGGSNIRSATDRYLPPPTPGMMLVTDDNVDYEAIAAEIRAEEVADDYKMILYALAACFSIPLELLDQRGSEQVYASIKKTSNPFHQKVMVLRNCIGNLETEFFRFILLKKQERSPNSLPKMIKKYVRNPKFGMGKGDNFIPRLYGLADCPIDLSWSNNFTEDWPEVASATKELTESATGVPILSKTTARRRLDLNDAEEDMLLEQEKKEEQEGGKSGENGKTSNGDDPETGNGNGGD